MAKTIELFPPNLREDKNIQAFASILDKVFSELTEQDLQKLFIYTINSQPEEVLDWLAWQFHVEGYDLSESLEEKRNLVKSAIELHRYKGTKHAIEKVLKALNISGEVKEWFEYGGEPYKFKIELGIQNREITPELRDKLLQLINEYKNERSWLEEILLSYLAVGAFPFAIGQIAETESFSECQTELEWLASGSIPLAVSSVAETEAVADMEA
ncbi:phage tail protein I [Desulfurobacterium indicum]|uniref:Phage tail protein I n=1 Tax=Desulfurobacterium indicum TaxID=1914305 RepID=A0A1R1MK88_9BACT|nr:phage tail protein I [Desulfurobacterium indicum]OMH40228.1 phage tail protein I [Desulfurobacterium indicum]